ncbi:NAD-dependent epimerase/dehydratase family protein [Ottowia thiooxydans]|uniref:NAD-dependent epimerase/dehydratase family protein n=1 Tax=Ottowia thiooxydans TaxID=219182 RepID=UPI000416E850|nr:NAD-dependent epimerase/dehydratase family protein [Ottowia thiooxydans]
MPNTSTSPASSRTVLLCGAQGFIGRALAQSLKTQGWCVRSASRSSQPPLDYANLRTASDWLPHLQGIDAVINAVGHLRGSTQAPLESIHAQAPMALFKACAESGIRRVMQLSALGIDGNETAYARTKRAADQHLQALTAAGQLDGVIVRPSIVLGFGGASTQLFMRLSQLPVLALPRPMFEQLIQPLFVGDLTQAMVRLLESGHTGTVELGGQQKLSMAAMIAALRLQRGLRSALVGTLPDWISHASARLGDAIPVSPWCSASLVLTSHDNCCNPALLRTWLGRDPVAIEQMLRHIKAHH